MRTAPLEREAELGHALHEFVCKGSHLTAHSNAPYRARARLWTFLQVVAVTRLHSVDRVCMKTLACPAAARAFCKSCAGVALEVSSVSFVRRPEPSPSELLCCPSKKRSTLHFQSVSCSLLCRSARSPFALPFFDAE
eukprot:2760716-Pleurochrysis_carterae.AAC.3